MDFFSHQDQARRNTGRLILLFAAAVVGMILAIYAVCVLLLGFLDTRAGAGWHRIELLTEMLDDARDGADLLVGMQRR